MSESALSRMAAGGIASLVETDPALYRLMEREFERQTSVLTLVAASSIVDPAVLACEGMVGVNVTAEGYPGARFHAGCRVIDEIEQLAIDRACAAFGARYANVQPHSATTANQLVMCSVLKPGDTLLGMDLSAGGHLTHGAKPSLSGQYFNAVSYGVTASGFIDYDQVRDIARRERPKLIICGTTAYPRAIDFAAFRAIADEVGAWLLADITHVAGLVIAGLHPNPIDHAHFTTTCTHKQIYGPRGGLVLIGRDSDTRADDGKRTLAQLVQQAVFPYFQGAPNLNSIAAKAAALARVQRPEFVQLASQIVANARALAAAFVERDYHVVTGGSDNHLVVIEVIDRGITGIVAERALESCDIIVNKNRIPGDRKSAQITSGIRLGTNGVALRGMTAETMARCAELVHRTLASTRAASDTDFEIAPAVAAEVRAGVGDLCRRFPIPCYPAA